MFPKNRYLNLIEQLPAITYIAEAGPHGKWLYVSPQIQNILGFSVDEWLKITNPWMKQIHPDDRDTVQENEQRCQALRRPFRAEFRMLTKSGETIWVRDEANFVYDSLGNPELYQGVILDITERKRVEEALLQSEESFKNLFFNNPLPMWVFDEKTFDFLEVNEAAMHLYGYTRNEFLAMNIFQIRPEGDRERLKQLLSTARPNFRHAGPWEHCKKGGEILKVEITSHTLSFEGDNAVLVVARDVTEKKQLEADKEKLESRLNQIHKMEALGHLAGGVAHDFNNLMMAISGYCEIARALLPSDKIRDSQVDEIHKAVLMGASLTNQLLAFSRKQPLHLSTLNLNDVVLNIEPMLRRLIRENIHFKLALDQNLGPVNADRNQIGQVILNLVVNASDAMPDGGILSVVTENVELDGSYTQQYPDILQGGYISLSVIDTGHGMDQETQSRIFEPFFTTKEGARGTGLGLATVFGIVKQSSGHVTVYSELHKGTNFRIYLPRLPESKNTRIAEDQHLHLKLPDGCRVLLVDDNDLVRRALSDLLEMNQCVVVQTSDAEKALKILKEGNPFEILMTDIVLPKFSGVELAEEARAILPEISILFMSGYPENVVQYKPDRKTAFLTKPVSIQKVLMTFSELMNADLASS